MALFLQAALGGDAAPLAAAFRETTRRLAPVPEMEGSIGLAWLLSGDPAKPIVWHNGQTSGYHAFVGFDTGKRRGVAVLVNETSGIEPLAFALLGAKPPRTAASTVANATDYVGRYPLNPTFSISVRDEKGVLTAQGSGQPRLRLRETARDRFALVGVPAEISFERNEAGVVQALVLHQNGRDQRAERSPLPPEPKEIAVPPELASEYLGTYDLPANRTLTISLNKDALFAQLSGQPKFGIYASAKDEFFYKVVDAHIAFVRDASGKVTGLTLHQGASVLEGKKR